MNNQIDRQSLVDAGNEWLKLQLKTGQEHLGKIFTEVSTNSYVTLLLLNSKLGLHESRVYLKEIAEELDTPMEEVSPRIGRLQDKGLVIWKHDENGTYITISQTGIELMQRQQEKLTDFMEEVVVNYGYDKFNKLIEYRMELNDLIDSLLDE